MITKKLLMAAVAVSGLAAATAAQSQSAEDSGFYVGGGIGRASVKAEFAGNTFKLDDWDTAWRAIAGYQLNKYVAFQVEYIDGGTQQQQTRGGVGTTVDTQFTNIVPSVLGILPINDTFSVYAKVGYDFYDTQLQAVTRAIVNGAAVVEFARYKDKESGEDLLYGAGVRVTRDKFSFDLLYEVVDVDLDFGVGDRNWDYSMLSASATFKF
jgi:OmpA-OmpF porin, OOP family